jgi:trans-aconitate methyltransferase
VLDLGAGTGLFSALIAYSFPGARITLLDVSDEMLARARERMKFDRTATLSAQLGWLREAGFREVACSYRNLIFAVYSGEK